MTTRAIMKWPNEVELIDDNTYTLTFHWFLIDNTGGVDFEIPTTTTILWTDTLAVVRSKIIDSVVAAATGYGLTLARTSVLLLTYDKGS